MKNLLLALALAISSNIVAQSTEKMTVQKTIETFFQNFHEQDTLALKEHAVDFVTMQTISKDSSGKVKVNTVPYADFITRIAGIPKSTKFEEKLKSFTVQVDGDMATAWTPYEFLIDGVFHHCGVNSFQLVKFDEDWKIVYLIDTRRTEDCD